MDFLPPPPKSHNKQAQRKVGWTETERSATQDGMGWEGKWAGRRNVSELQGLSQGTGAWEEGLGDLEGLETLGKTGEGVKSADQECGTGKRMENRKLRELMPSDTG